MRQLFTKISPVLNIVPSGAVTSSTSINLSQAEIGSNLIFNAVGVGKGVTAGFVEVGEKRTGVLVARMISGVIARGVTGGSVSISDGHNWSVERKFNPQAETSKEPVAIKHNKANLRRKRIFGDIRGVFCNRCVRLVIKLIKLYFKLRNEVFFHDPQNSPDDH